MLFRSGSFIMRAGHVDAAVAWYAEFWRRFWYEDFTGRPSQVASNVGPAPDRDGAMAWMREAGQPLRLLEQRARHIATLTRRRPIPASMLQREQALLRQEREKLLPRMMAHSATGPATVAMIRDIHNDGASDLAILADQHVKAYRRWQQRIARVRTVLSEAPAQVERRPRSLPLIQQAVSVASVSITRS